MKHWFPNLSLASLVGLTVFVVLSAIVITVFLVINKLDDERRRKSWRLYEDASRRGRSAVRETLRDQADR
jgi:hypothetical protein